MASIAQDLSNRAADADEWDEFGPLAVEFAGLASLAATIADSALYRDDGAVAKWSAGLGRSSRHLGFLKTWSVARNVRRARCRLKRFGHCLRLSRRARSTRGAVSRRHGRRRGAAMTDRQGEDDWSVTLCDPVEDDEKGKKARSPRGRRTDTTMRELLQELELWKGSDGQAYATARNDGRARDWRIESATFAHWLRFRAQLRGEALLGETEVAKLTANLVAHALGCGTIHEVWYRVGQHGENLYVDLGDDDWRVVEIVPAKPETAERWRVIKGADCPVRFARSPNMKPMPAPAPGCPLDELRRWINVETEGDFRLAIAWLLASYRPRGPFPLLSIRGGHGSGKSTLTRLMTRLVDPQRADARSSLREPRDLWIAAQGARLLALDNLSSISNVLADELCRLATGGVFTTRALRTDQEEVILQACRPILMNSIVELARRPDLADRALLIEAKPLADGELRTEEDFWREFGDEEPMLLGALFDAVSAAMGAYQETPVPAKLRMADAARFAEAASAFLNWRPGELSEIWRANRAASDEIVLESNIVAAVLLEFLEGKDSWEGKTGELRKILTESVDDSVRRSKEWPKTAQGMRSVLDRVGESLKSQGWVFTRLNRAHKGTRPIAFTRLPSLQ
jgi:putative DNA primase/helicase